MPEGNPDHEANESVFAHPSKRRRMRLPTDFFLEMKPMSFWLREELRKKGRFAGRFEKLSEDQENVLLATTTLAAERESILLALINRDFVTMLVGAVEWTKGALRAPLLVSSQFPPPPVDAGENAETGDPDAEGRPNSKPKNTGWGGWFLSQINLQNFLVLAAIGLLSFGAYQKVRTETLESTVTALQENLSAIEENRETQRSAVETERQRADALYDDLAVANATLADYKQQIAGLSAENESLKEQVGALRTDLTSLRSSAEASADEAIAARDATISGLRTKIDDLTASLSTAQQNYASADAVNKATAARTAELESRVKELNSQLAQSNQAIRAYRDNEVNLRRFETAYTIAQLALDKIKAEVDKWGDADEDDIRVELNTFFRRTREILRAN